MEVRDTVCAVCQQPAQQMCSACKMVKYCCVDHQRQHWKHHKPNCQPYAVGKDDILGRFLFATKDITAGSCILREPPLVIGPKWYLSEQDLQNPIIPCVGCNRPCRMDGVHCPTCRWPICSLQCPALLPANGHHLECSVLALGSGPRNSDLSSLIDYYRTDALLVLKCLLLQKQDATKWLQLKQMQSHVKERQGTDLQIEAEKRVVQYLHVNFLQRLKNLERQSKTVYFTEYDKTVLRQLCGIIETNYMCINLPNGLELSGLFPTASLLEHSCQPNCYFTFDAKQDYRISLYAGCDIRKGEHLRLIYTNILWPTQMRQEHLTLTKHFRCQCQRCCDPTELGTYFNAFKCLRIVLDAETKLEELCRGLQVPREPLNPKTDWMCNKCQVVLSNKEINSLLENITADVDAVLEQQQPCVDKLELLLVKLRTFLSPTHYHMFSLKHTLIQVLGKESKYTTTALDGEHLEYKLHLCQELYESCKKLDPYWIRLGIYVAIVLYEKHTVLLEQARRLDEESPSAADDAKLKHKEAASCLEEAAAILQKEQDNIAGNKLLESILKAIAEMKAYSKTNEAKSSN